MNVKQVIVIRRDLKMRRGKEVSQGAHAAMEWLLNRLKMSYDRELYLSPAEEAWMNGQHAKVTLQVEDEKALHEVYRAARLAGLEVNMVTDSGKTEFQGVPTRTCLAIGPDEVEKIDAITGELKLY